MNLGDKVRELREARGWNQSELARRRGPKVSPQNIQQLEDGTVKQPRYLADLARALGATVEELLSSSPPRVAEPASVYGVRKDILSEVIEVVEEMLAERKLQISAGKKTELIMLVYEDTIEEESQGKAPDRDRILKLVNLAS